MKRSFWVQLDRKKDQVAPKVSWFFHVFIIFHILPSLLLCTVSKNTTGRDAFFGTIPLTATTGNAVSKKSTPLKHLRTSRQVGFHTLHAMFRVCRCLFTHMSFQSIHRLPSISPLNLRTARFGSVLKKVWDTIVLTTIQSQIQHLAWLQCQSLPSTTESLKCPNLPDLYQRL